MPETFTAQPNAPIVEKNGYASVAEVGYRNQFDLVEPQKLIGRWLDTTGPFQWVTLGAGLALSPAGVLYATVEMGGDVSGPGSSTNGYVPLWDGSTGQLLQDSAINGAWFDQDVSAAATPTFAGASLGALSVGGFAFTVGGAPTLNDWFNQSVKTGASPAFTAVTVGGLTVNTFAVTVNGAVTLNNWFDQSVKTTADVDFNSVTTVGDITAGNQFFCGAAGGSTQTGLGVALSAGGSDMTFDLVGGIICNIFITP